MSIEVRNKNTGYQLINLGEPITVTIKDIDGNVIHCDHAQSTMDSQDVFVGLEYNGNSIEESRIVETCDTCNQTRQRVLCLADNEYEWTDWK